MGRFLVKPAVGTKESFLKVFGDREDVHAIENAEVYWRDDGMLILVTTPAWRDYFIGKREQIPDRDFGAFDADFDIDILFSDDGGM